MTVSEKNISSPPVVNKASINKNNVPFFSIITPIYNSEKFLKEYFESILEQEFRDYEIILVNDGSLDSSQEIINTYKTKFPKLNVINQANLGPGVARNIGLANAKGLYTLFIDSDDRLSTPKALLDLYYYLVDNSSSDIVIYGYTKLYGKIIVKPTYKHRNLLNLPPVQTIEEKEKLIKFNKNGIPWNKVYKTQFLLSNNIIFAPHLKFEDAYFFWLAIILAKKITFFNYIFYYYRKHKDSTMKQYDKGNLDIIKIYQLIIDFLKQKNLYSHFYSCLLNRALPSFLAQFKKVPFNLKKEFFSKLKAFQLQYIVYNYTNYSLNKNSLKILKALKTQSFIWFYLKSLLL